jgi:hypothetical protein
MVDTNFDSVLQCKLNNARPCGASPKGNVRIVLILWCEDMKLNGRLSEKLGQLSALEEIYMDHNFLRDSIPSQLGHLASWMSCIAEKEMGKLDVFHRCLCGSSNLVRLRSTLDLADLPDLRPGKHSCDVPGP